MTACIPDDDQTIPPVKESRGNLARRETTKSRLGSRREVSLQISRKRPREQPQEREKERERGERLRGSYVLAVSRFFAMNESPSAREREKLLSIGRSPRLKKGELPGRIFHAFYLGIVR